MENQNQTQYDPQAVSMVRAIKMQESGNNYNTKPETAGQSLGGAYMYQKSTWQNYAGQILGDQNAPFTPENQDKVTYGMVKKWKDSGMQPADIAKQWNPGDPKYPDEVVSKLKQIAGNKNQPNQGYNPKPFSQPTNGNNIFAVDTSGQPKITPEDNGFLSQLGRGDYGSAAVSAVKGVGNFLFPVLGDIGAAFQGKNDKSFGQWAGDIALSALPFIPGLGEAGELAKGAEAVGEGAKIAETGGLLSKFAGLSPVAKGAITGYGAGVASNLSQGKNIGESLVPGVNTIGGAVLGGATPKILEGATGLIKKIAGISPQIENELTQLGTKADTADSNLYNKYINAAKEHAGNVRASAPLNIAADTLDSAAEKISQKTKQAGAEVEAAKQASANIPLKSLQEVGKSFWKNVQDKYGLNLFTKNDGTIIAKPIEGTMVDVSNSDKSRITKIAQQLSDLNNGKTTKNATEVIGNFNNLVDFSKQDIYGHTNDPLEGLIKNTAGNLNDVIRSSSPDLATANDKFSNLKGLQDEIQGMAGKNLQKGELLMRRVFSGDKSGDIQDLFGKIKNETGIDLIKHAVLAKHAIESVGSFADKTLLEQIIGEAGAGKGGIFNSVLNIGKSALKKTISNPEKIGRNLITGSKSGLIKNILNKGAIEAGSRFSGLIGK